MYGHPQGGRFVPNITPIPGQSYVYHPSSGVHPGLQHAQIPPSSTLNHTVASYTQPQTTDSIASSAGYHPSPPTPMQPQYISPVETLHPMQAPSISIKIEKSAEDTSSGLYQRSQPTIIHKNLIQTHQHVLSQTQQPTIIVHDSQLFRQRADEDAELTRQQATKILLQQQQAQQQHIIAVPDVSLNTHVQKEQQEKEAKEQRERDIQRMKVIEDHQKQKNSNRIFSNSTKNLTDVTKLDPIQSLNRVSCSSTIDSTSNISISPAEHGFRKITAPSEPSVSPKSRSPIPQIDVKVYKCIMCGFLAESAALLGRHAFEIHEKRSKKWRVGQKFPVRHECDECDYETPDIHRLHRHMQRVHDTAQVFHFQCKECDFIATSADLLGRHALEVHEAGSVFRCSLCDFTSNRKSDRDRHYTGAHQLDYDTYISSSGGMPPSKQMYACLVPNCKEPIRGDKIRDHYKKFVNFPLLEENDLRQNKKLQVLNCKEAEHTQHFINKNLDAHSIPGYKKHKKIPVVASSSDADSNFDIKESRKRRKRRGRPLKRSKKSKDEWNETDTEEDEVELKQELKELGVKEVVKDGKDSDVSRSNMDYEDTTSDSTETENERTVEFDEVAKTIEKVLDKEGKMEQMKDEVFPKKCNLCCEEFSDKLTMIEHIRNKHISKSSRKSESTKPRFEIIRQQPSKCLEIIREETSKCN